MVMGEYISASKCWSLLRGGLSQDGSLNRGTMVHCLFICCKDNIESNTLWFNFVSNLNK